MISFHPLAEVLPLIEGAEFAELVTSIKANGLRDPIVTLDNMILDGRNRYRACLEAGVEPVLEPFTGNDPVALVLDKNVNRRHLNSGQRAMAVVKFATLSNGNPRRDLTAGLPVVKTVPEIAMMVGVNKATISDAKTICASGTKEDITSVVNGSATITRVANMVRARRPEAPVTFDRPTAVPKGETISGLVRKGIKLQQLGEPALPLAKKLGLSWRAYRAARDIILLSENEYLSKKEMAVVTKALHDLDQTRMLAKAEQAVAPIAKRVWGHKGQRLKKSKPRVERHTKRFDGAITFLLHTCEIAVEMSIPQLDGAKVAEATRQLSAAETLLRKLAKRIREMQHD